VQSLQQVIRSNKQIRSKPDILKEAKVQHTQSSPTRINLEEEASTHHLEEDEETETPFKSTLTDKAIRPGTKTRVNLRSTPIHQAKDE